MISVEKISKSFGNLTALHDINFRIERGEIVALLGPNGAGKTTLIRLMTGLLSPTEGRIVYQDKDIAKERVSVLHQIGYIPENAPLYNDMTVFEFLNFTAEIWNIKEQILEERLKHLVNKLELKTVLNRPIGELSKGYRHRVAIAGALIHGPKILIMDEPSEGLDPNQKYGLRSFIREFASQGAVLLSTHIMEDVEAIANRIILLNEGKMVTDTTPMRLKYQMPERDLSSAFRRITEKQNQEGIRA